MLRHPFTVRAADYEEVEPLRALLRREADCQIVRDSILKRGLADPYLILVDGHVGGYAGVWNQQARRLMEFYTVAEQREHELVMFLEVLRVSQATHIEAQSNMPRMAAMLNDRATDITEEKILFDEGPPTQLTCPGAVFRGRNPNDVGPEGEWVIELCGHVVAAGGVLYHYNPPYGDVYMEVIEEARRQGLGSYLVQELRRVCHEEGKKPAARCDPGNKASQGALQRGGFRECGRLLAGRLR